MSFWSVVITGMLLSILAGVVFVVVAICVLKWFAVRATEQINKSIQEAARLAGQAAEEQARRILAAKGIDAQAIQDKFGQQVEIVAAGASQRIREYARQNGLDIDEAKAKFFASTERLAKLMDSAVELPLVGAIGMDAVLGFVPWVGDLAAKGVSFVIICNAAQYGLPKELVGKMLTNCATDLLIGYIPVLGSVVDIFYRDNKKNTELLKEYLEQTGQLRRAMPSPVTAKA